MRPSRVPEIDICVSVGKMTKSIQLFEKRFHIRALFVMSQYGDAGNLPGGCAMAQDRTACRNTEAIQQKEKEMDFVIEIFFGSPR